MEIETDEAPAETDREPRAVPVLEPSVIYIVPAEVKVPDCLETVNVACVPLMLADMRRMEPQVPPPLVVEVGEAV